MPGKAGARFAAIKVWCNRARCNNGPAPTRIPLPVFAKEGVFKAAIAKNDWFGQSAPLRWSRAAADSLFTLLFPAVCKICEQPIEVITAVPVCPDCVNAPKAYSGPECAWCGRFLATETALHGTLHCGVCRRFKADRAAAQNETFAFEQARSFASHEGTLRALVQRLKCDGYRPLAKPLGRCLARAAERLSEQSFDLIVPVPLHRKRERQRGFNQAELLAAELARLRHIPLGARDCMRVRDTPPQTGLRRAERRKNVAGAFDVPSPQRVEGKRVLLIDDVLTTGATASSCAQALRQAGAAGVWVATVARANPVQIDVL
jgi:ComF family protein